MLSLTDDEWGTFLPEETDTLPVYGLWTAPDGVKTWVTAPLTRVKPLAEMNPYAYLHQLQQQQFEHGQDFHAQAQAQTQAQYQAQLTQYMQRWVDRDEARATEQRGRMAAAAANLTPQPDPVTVEPARETPWERAQAWADALFPRRR